MNALTDTELAKWKKAFAKSGIYYSTDDEYREAATNLVGYFELLIQMDQEQKEAQQPEGPPGEIPDN